VVKVCIYLEGGASGPGSKALDIRCERAFHKLLHRMGFSGRMPRLVACGARDRVYRDFCRAHHSANNPALMWIDSEEPLADLEKAWEHLKRVTSVAAWDRPEGAMDEQVLFMTTCMETLIVADREMLRRIYGKALNENPLPAGPGLEGRARQAVQKALITATRESPNAYSKGKMSFLLLEQVAPDVLEKLLLSFARTARILKTIL
jgi:hypothetical protein